MATYLELAGIKEDADLRKKIAVACVLAAEEIRTEPLDVPEHGGRLAWAKRVYASPMSVADSMVWPVLAQNSTATQPQILAASDAAILTAVKAAIAVFL